jgi:hypothetical protein
MARLNPVMFSSGLAQSVALGRNERAIAALAKKNSHRQYPNSSDQCADAEAYQAGRDPPAWYDSGAEAR